jgi:hypothetical protein
VFDDVLLHHFKERHIFDLASQPFSPVNIYNEIMENTGVFKSKNTTFTSVFIIDSDSSSLMFKKDELVLQQHLESISDQILEFNNEGNMLVKGYLPMVDLRPSKNILAHHWQSPYLRLVNREIQELISELNRAQSMHQLRKQLKMDEDPWENYLIHDSRYIMPILCHSQELSIEEQILVAKFIKQAIRDENISEYQLKGSALIKELLTFTNEFKDEEEDPTVLERLTKCLAQKELVQEDYEKTEREIERVIKMFYLQMRVRGQLKQYKEDYFI